MSEVCMFLHGGRYQGGESEHMGPCIANKFMCASSTYSDEVHNYSLAAWQ